MCGVGTGTSFKFLKLDEFNYIPITCISCKTSTKFYFLVSAVILIRHIPETWLHPTARVFRDILYNFIAWKFCLNVFFDSSYSDLHIIKTDLLTAILYKKVPLFINFPNIFKAIADLKKNTAIITISNIIQMRMFMQLFCCNELNPVLWMSWGPDHSRTSLRNSALGTEHHFEGDDMRLILCPFKWTQRTGPNLQTRKRNFYSWEGFEKLFAFN